MYYGRSGLIPAGKASIYKRTRAPSNSKLIQNTNSFRSCTSLQSFQRNFNQEVDKDLVPYSFQNIISVPRIMVSASSFLSIALLVASASALPVAIDGNGNEIFRRQQDYVSTIPRGSRSTTN